MGGREKGVEGLFAYGTLAVPRVLEALTGHRFQGRPATLPGHVRYRVRGRVHPAAIARADGATDGILYEDVDAAAWPILDAFEGEGYERRSRSVVLHDGNERRAFVYLLRRDQEHTLTSEDWKIEEFERRHASRYEALCRAFRAAHLREQARGEARR